MQTDAIVCDVDRFVMVAVLHNLEFISHVMLAGS